ncbi:MAG: RNA ligase [Candidatus Chromulinivorax sp.]
MRKIVILRGAQGSGKSTFVINQQLESYVISSDSIRLLFGSVLMTPEGMISINHENEHKVWSFIDEILDKRMSRGEFIIFDATFQKTNDFSNIIKKAKLYRYQIFCIDFSDIPLEVTLTRNKLRSEYKQVHDDTIRTTYQNIINQNAPEEITVLPSQIFEHQKLIDYLDIKKVNLNHYKKIHHIGDIQGCFEPLKKYLEQGLQEDEYYIFVGDYLDRGIQNDQVMQFILQSLIHLPNVTLLWGNHETHIHRFALGEKSLSREFSYQTIPQLMKINFSQDQAEQLCQKLVDCFIYEYAGYSCFVTHAGISKVPKNPILIPSTQYWHGTGAYEYPVDQMFSQTMHDTNWLQIHGHRNKNFLPVQASEKSFNLEAQVEFGGYLRVMTLDKNGTIEVHEIKNNTYNKQKNSDGTLTIHSNEIGKISTECIEKLDSNKLVRKNQFETYPHIFSYTFKPSVFFKKSWNDVAIKARGLFVDNHRTIVARAYDKFFNIGEISLTTIDNLALTLKFPLSVYVKENGYLGILGYDEQKDSLFFTSKSNPESIYASNFKEIFTQQISKNYLASLKNYLRSHNASLVFEVIDPFNDPHIIEYDSAKIILLDIILRTETFTCLPYTEIEKIALEYGFTCKNKAMQFNNWQAFLGWYQAIAKEGKNFKFKNKDIEGFVLQDSNNFLCKIKLPYYNHWRYMRTIKDQLIESRLSGKAMKVDFDHPDAIHFYTWIQQQPDDVLSENIINLRKLYMQEYR